MKRIISLFLSLLIVGCTSGVQIRNDGKSRTYSFFKDFDNNHYYVSFWDRNNSINDDTKIIIARSDDKYYYELDGYERTGVIQKDGIRYNINFDRNQYYKEEKDIEDFSLGILPKTNELRDKEYKTGKEKIYNSFYVFESFDFDYGKTTYYFKGKKLIYVRFKSVQNEILLKYNEMKKDFDSNIFEIDNFEEITY